MTCPVALTVSNTVQNSRLSSVITIAPVLVDARTIATLLIWLRPIMMPFSSQFHISSGWTLYRWTRLARRSRKCAYDATSFSAALRACSWYLICCFLKVGLCLRNLSTQWAPIVCVTGILTTLVLAKVFLRLSRFN